MKQFQLSTWIYSLLLALLLAAQGADAADTVRIAVPPSPMSLPFYVAAERKFFEKYQVKPELIGCSSGQECIEALGLGKADLASSSELPVMFAAYEKKPVSVLATLVTNKDDLNFLVSHNLFSDGRLNLAGKKNWLCAQVVLTLLHGYFFAVQGCRYPAGDQGTYGRF